MVPPGRLRAAVAYHSWQKAGCRWKENRTGGLQRRTRGREEKGNRRKRNPWVFRGGAQVVSAEAESWSSRLFCAGQPRARGEDKGRFPRSLRGWRASPALRFRLTGSGPLAEGQRGGGDGQRLHVRGGEEEEAQNKKAGLGTNPHQSSQSSRSGPTEAREEEAEEPQPITIKEKEKKQEEALLRFREWERLRQGKLFGRKQLGRAAEETFPADARVGLQDAGGSSRRTAGSRRIGGRRVRGSGPQRAEAEDEHLLPGAAQAAARPAWKRLQRAGNARPLPGFTPGRAARRARRCFGRKADSSRHGDSSGMGNCPSPRSLRGRRGEYSTGACAFGSTAACPPSREGGWKRIVAQAIGMVRRRLGFGKSPQKKREGEQRKGQEGQAKRKRSQGVEYVEHRRAAKARRQGEERRCSDMTASPAAVVQPLGGPNTAASAGGPGPCDEASTVPSLPAVLDGPSFEAEGEPELALANSLLSEFFGQPLDTAFVEEIRCVEPSTRTEWLASLCEVRDLQQLGCRLAWGLKAGWMLLFPNRARPSRPASHRRCGLFPLPVAVPAELTWESAGLVSCGGQDLAIGCWVALGCAAVNALYGCPGEGWTRRPGKVHTAALGDMRKKIERFLKGSVPPDTSFGDAVRDLKDKKVSYTGEEVSQPHCLSIEQIEKGLPPKGHGGSVPILPFLHGRAKFLLEHPEESLLEESQRGLAPISAKVHIQKGEEVPLFSLLHERGVISWEPADSVFRDNRGAYLSGLFGVIKAGKFTASGKPVLRVIMNLIPINGLFEIIRGDIANLPHASSWIPLCVCDGEEIVMSQADMSSAFYLFRLPPQWRPYMCFNFVAKGSDIGLEGLEPGLYYRPACRVLPMGWSSSVGIMQAISREILLAGGLPPALELKKGEQLPPWFTQAAEKANQQRSWWQVYLDNFLSVTIEQQTGPSADEAMQRLAVASWHSAGVLTAEDKQVLASKQATELGVRIDGVHGLLGSSAERLMKTCWVTFHHLCNPVWSKKEAQIILGRWIFILQFRRAAMSVLSRSWAVLEERWPKPGQRAILERELLTLVALGPLLQTDLTAVYDSEVTCSDASESGGVAAVSRNLTWSGRSFVSRGLDLRRSPLNCPLLVISIFNGIGGAFRIYDILGIEPVGRISVDVSRAGNRVTRTTWPDVLELHDVNSLDKQEVRRWANVFSGVREVHLLAGFPCVHLSSARYGRLNLEGEGSNLFWKLLEIISWVQEVFQPTATVKFCVENVASMDEEARRRISSELQVCPIKLDPADSLPYSRPHFAWTSETLYEMQGLSLWTEKEYVRAYTEPYPLLNEQWIRPGWSWKAPVGTVFPTFMKAIKRARPPPQPAGLFRTSAETRERWIKDSFKFPPYQYNPQFLLSSPGKPSRLLDSSERELLLGFGPQHTASCMSASSMKQSFSEYEDTRLSLCGDSFSILSFSIIAAQMSSSFSPRMTPHQIISRLGLAPGATAHPSISIPLSRRLAYGGDVELPRSPLELVQQLGRSLNHTGCDVRISTGQIMGQKTPTHASVRAWWWQWKHLFKVKWNFSSHINFLEMKMILLTLLWKARSPSKVNKRWLHLEDSLVSLYILSKGRTSSLVLQPLARQIGAIQLAMGSMLIHGHVGSAENPTDAASRR